MNDLPKIYFSMQTYLFPMREEEFCEIAANMKEFISLIEVIKPSRFINSNMHWSELDRPMASRENILRAFFLKSIYNFATTKMLIESLRANLTLCRLCGWEYASCVLSKATFSRAFKAFSEGEILESIHEIILKEHYTDKIVGHASIDSTAIIGRDKSCRKNKSKNKLKKKRGRKSQAEKLAMDESEQMKIKTRRLELQVERKLSENMQDLPRTCDWGGKQNSKGKPQYWLGYKFHISTGDGGVPLGAVLTSALLHDSQVAIPLMQMTAERVGFRD